MNDTHWKCIFFTSIGLIVYQLVIFIVLGIFNYEQCPVFILKVNAILCFPLLTLILIPTLTGCFIHLYFKYKKIERIITGWKYANIISILAFIYSLMVFTISFIFYYKQCTNLVINLMVIIYLSHITHIVYIVIITNMKVDFIQYPLQYGGI